MVRDNIYITNTGEVTITRQGRGTKKGRDFIENNRRKPSNGYKESRNCSDLEQ